MKEWKKALPVAIAAAVALSACASPQDPADPIGPGPAPAAEVYDMRTSDMQQPVIDGDPVFSWKVRSDEIGWAQTAYKIVVKKDGKTVWNSNKVKSDRSVGIAYGGDPLVSSSDYTWNVTVWDKQGVSVTSAEAAFSTGLLTEEELAAPSFISFAGSALSDETAYTIDFDFIIDRDNQGFCFGMQGASSFAMWQVNTFDANGSILLRPHFKDGGWTAYPGGPGNVAAVDVSAAIGYDGRTVIGKRIHERIEVDGRTVRTYFGADADSLNLASVYTHDRDIPLGGIGFRHSSEAGGAHEIARYDNIRVTRKDGGLLYANDFSDGKSGFLGSHCAVEDGMLKVGSADDVGELVYVSASEGGLPAYRKSFAPHGTLASAKLYTTALGVYEAYLNGNRVGQLLPDGTTQYHELKPGSTEMAVRKFYNAYDVTHLIGKGENVLSAVVTSGWWSGKIAAGYGKETAFWAYLLMEYADGTREVLVTDESWKSSRASAVLMADIYNGETYDNRISSAWQLPGFDDGAWGTVKKNTEFQGTVCAWDGPFITVRGDLGRKAVHVDIFDGAENVQSGAYGKIRIVRTAESGAFTLHAGETAVVDFGQNFAGWEAFEVSGEAGTTVTIEHGEMCNDGNGETSRGNDGPAGSVYNANYRGAEATTRYTLSGEGKEQYHPSFTYYGFRYLQITADRDVTFSDVRGEVVTSVDRDTGELTTSDADVNRLISNVRWGQYSNYLSVPTDCPQRDERLGWMADTQIFAEAGSYLAFSKGFLEKFMQDVRDCQRADGAFAGNAPTGQYGGSDWGGTGWADAGIIVPHTLYAMYGDASVIEENWDAMTAYMNYLARFGMRGPNSIWGDWVAYESNDSEIQAILAAAFYAWDARMMAEMAEATGRSGEANDYYSLYDAEKAYFAGRYVKSDGTLVRGEQSVCLYALYLDLLPDEASRAAVEEQLLSNIRRNGNKLQTGFLGTAIILPTLTKIGRSDVAYTLLLQHEDPSWLYSVDQGATTIWERWNSYTVESGFGPISMNSFNHYAYGAVAGWMFRSMAGIGYDLQTPGCKRLVIAPQPDGRIAEVSARYDSAYGDVAVHSVLDGDSWVYELTLPANTSAEVRLPAAVTEVNGIAVGDLVQSIHGIAYRRTEDGVAIFRAVAGKYIFRATLR